MASIAPNTAAGGTQTQSADPPRWLTNMLRYILRSPLHGMFSKSLILLEFRGRKTGKTYSTPLSYLREGDIVTAFTDSLWQRNLVGDAPVTVYLKGSPVKGFAHIITNRGPVTEGVTRLLRAVPSNARYFGIRFDPDGQPIREEVERGSQHHVMLKIQLSG